MHKNGQLQLMIVVALCLGMAACGLEERTATVQPGDGAVATSAVETFAAQLTLSAGRTAVAQLTQLATDTPQVTPVSPTTAPLTPTATPQPPTPTPSPTRPPPTSPVCDQAQLIANVSVDDGTFFSRGRPSPKPGA